MKKSAPQLPPLITAAVAEKIFAAMDRGDGGADVSLDLNISLERVTFSGGNAFVREFTVSSPELAEVLKRPAAVFSIGPEGLSLLEVRGEGYHKLVPTSGAPTVEISGVRMHRTFGIDPFDDARTKVEPAVRRNDSVLDTCAGLGYTAIWARRLGAGPVVSVEVDPAVIRLRRLNPWSSEYLEDEAIKKLDGDVFRLIDEFPGSSFDSILHDPPRFSLAGELYGEEFIGQMFRVLKRRGRLIFYTGEPYRRGRGRDFVAGVGRRLKAAGFDAEWRRDLFSYVALRR